MRLPSLEALITGARATLVRFPAVLFAAVLAAVAGIVAVDEPDLEFWGRLFGTAALAIPLFLATDLFAERKAWPTWQRVAAWGVGAVLLAGFMAAWFDWSDPVAGGRYFQVSAAAHLLVAFLPFVASDQLQGFWQYNKTLFLRAVTAVVFTGVLNAGLAIALVALDNLFGLDVADLTYARLAIALWFVFTTWFFLAGVPKNLDELDTSTDYPAVIKVFAQFILVPIVIVYLVILTLYLGKVLITQEWPSGWIGWLVSSVTAVGIFSLLLVHPIAERTENQWIKNYARGFYIALLPSIVMLWLAIWKRIDQYGVTERRYFLAVLSAWLAGIAIYYAVRRSRDIRVIPWSLCLVGLVTITGPWGAYSISASSQVSRLAGILERNEILQDGAIQPAPAEVPFEDRREISEILRYLTTTHGTARIAGWFGDRLAGADTTDGDERYSAARAELIADLMGVPYVERWESVRPGRFSYRARWDDAVVPVAGYTSALRIDGLDEDSSVVEGLTVRYDSAAFAIRFSADGQAVGEIALQDVLDAARAFAEEAGRSRLPPQALRIDIESPRLSLAAYISRIAGQRGDEGVNLWDLDLQLFYTVRQ
jgi:hypothetical protein